MGITKRDIAVAVILSLVTCGIYGYYWTYKLTEDVNYLNSDYSFDPALVIVFSIITCGIYYYYWAYKMGERITNAQYRYGVCASDNAVVYLLLSIFGFSIVAQALMQDSVNKMAYINPSNYNNQMYR